MYKPFERDEEIEAIGERLLDRTLDKARFTHAGHFAAAVWLLARRPEIDLEREMPGIIRAYNVSVGGENTDTAGYHETITRASLRAARAMVVEGAPLFVTVNAIMASALGERDWLMAYWTRERLFSVEARRGWVEPDLRALPF